VTVSGDAVLGGTGSIAARDAGRRQFERTLSPGSPVSATADLATGSLTLHSGTTLAMQINGLTPAASTIGSSSPVRSTWAARR
jgi:hypothetical protein